MSGFELPPSEEVTAARVHALRAKLLSDMELLAGAVFLPEDRDEREALVELCESLHHLAEAFMELR